MATLDPPKISVTIPNHDHGCVLGRALEAVCTQNPPPCEVYVFDDCSTDNSVDIVRSYAQRFAFVHLVRYPEKSDNWQKAHYDNWSLLSGDYVMNLGADDYPYAGFLAAVSEMIAKHPGVGVVFADHHYLNAQGKITAKNCCWLPGPCYLKGPQLVEQLIRFDSFETGGIVVARKDAFLWLHQNHGTFDLGPWDDTVGIPVIALKYGACYVPNFLGAVCIESVVPGRPRFARRQVDRPAYFQKVMSFLGSPEIAPHVPAEVLESLEWKLMPGVGPDAELWQRLMARARRYLEAGKLDEADQWMGRLFRMFFAEQVFAYFGTYQPGQPLAEAVDRGAISVFPHVASRNWNGEGCRLDYGYLQAAMLAYECAIRQDPASIKHRASLGILLFEMGRTQEALVTQERVVQLDPQESLGYTYLGNTLQTLGRVSEALASHSQAVQLLPQSFIAVLNLASVMLRAGQTAMARTHFARLVKFNPFQAGPSGS